MKHILLALLALFTFAVQAQESTIVNNQLVVYGTGKVEKFADQATITFSVKGVGPSIQVAAEKARKQVSDIAAKLLAVGLTQENLRTAHFTSGTNYGDKAFLSSSRDFRTLIESKVTLDSLGLLEKVITVLASGEVERLSNVSFGLKNDVAIKIEARRQAIINAQEKATVMANQLGLSLGKVTYVEEIPSGSGRGEDFPYVVAGRPLVLKSEAMDQAFADLELPGTSLFSQEFTVGSTVKVVFEISSNK